MPVLPLARTFIAAAVLGCLGTLSASAQELVSVRSAKVNLRNGPGTDQDILWQLTRGYPLQVLDRQGNWLKVQDFEGDQGWIAGSVTTTTPHHVVKATSVNLRAGPGTQYNVVGHARYGDVLRTNRRQGDWVQVQHPSGKGAAWVASELLWGW